MIKSQFKIKILKKVDELKSFLILPVLLLISVTTISIHDTYKNEKLFFSHRRSNHKNLTETGRMINIVSFA